MIITKEMFDEFVESAENQNILWTTTLALIGVTVGDVPDVDVIDAQAAEIARLRAVVERLEATQHRGPVVTYKRGFGPGDGDGATLAQETQP